MRRLITVIFLALVSLGGFAAEDYQIGAGDSLKITVYNHPDLATETRLGDDGALTFPLLGRVVLAGLSKANAEQRLANMLVDGGYLRQAEVNIVVTDYRSQQVSVLGEVAKPGKYPISGATTVMDILAQAGGVNDKGASTIRIIQHDRAGNASQRDIDMAQLVAANGAANMSVHSGDIIFVAPQPMFYIYGEVQRPGAYPLQREMTIRQAIALGGGLTIRGTEHGLKVSRRSKSGAVEVHHAKLNDQLMAGDVVQVKEALF